MKFRQECKAVIRKLRMIRLRNDLAKVDKNMCSLHPEWMDMTREEKSKINRWEVCAHKCYKNIPGGGILNGMFLMRCIKQKFCPG